MTIMTYIIYALIRKRNDIYNICSKSLSFSGRERWEFGPSLEGKSEVRSLEGRGEVGCGVKKERSFMKDGFKPVERQRLQGELEDVTFLLP